MLYQRILPTGPDLSKFTFSERHILITNIWGPFLEIPDNFPRPVSIFLNSFICQLMVFIGANLAICFTKSVIKIKI